MSDAVALNRVTPTGDQFTVVTLRVLDEAPDLGALTAWYRTHLHQIVVVNRLEGTPDFAFTAAPMSSAEIAALAQRLAATEHSVDITGRAPDAVQTDPEPFGADSLITASGYDLGGGQWLSVVVGTLNWRTALSEV